MKNKVKKNTVLVIEDEEDVRNFVSRLLELEGYEVLTAETGESGLDIARASEISLVVLDLKLPGMDGWAVIKEMRGNASLSGVPVILFTAAVNALERAKAQKLANTYYLPKPVNVVTMKTLVKRILNSAR